MRIIGKKPIGMLGACVTAAIVLSACNTGDPVVGKQKSVVCQSCHGVDGNSTNPQFPRLAGQYPDYIVQALSEYKSGERKNPIMSGFAASLSKRDMQDIAAYFASQKSVLHVLKR
ncbi:MAG: c-type cytochrome [Sulfuricaulis sp.]